MIVGVRHAQVLNPEGVVYARLPGFRLSEAGESRAKDLGDALASAPVVAVYASPLERATETAAILATPHGLPVVIDERLLEWSFWVRWQGLPWNRIRERDPDLLRTYAEDPGSASPDDTLEDTGRRVLSWADEAASHHAEGLVLGVSHEAPLIAAMLLGAGKPMARYHSVNLPHLSTVRLLPGPPEPVDLVQWARSC